MSYRSINPFSGELLDERASLSPADVDRLFDVATDAQRRWARRSLSQRMVFVARIAALLRTERDALALRCTMEMGKPIADARAEVEKCAALCDSAVQLASRALAPVRVTEDALGAWRVEYQPIGTVLAIMPWNFPYWQALRVIVPNLLLGNAVVHKPAGSVAGCAALMHALLEQAAADSGSEGGLTPCLLVESERIADMIAGPHVHAVTLTGSEAAGRSVAETAGRHLKKVVLELGGSDPFVVLSDANIKRAARAAARGRMVNGGQSCIAAKRFIVCEDIAEEFEHRFSDEVRRLRVGDPMHAETQIGPLATERARDELRDQVDATLAAGARVLARATLPADDRGFFYAPTVLVDVPVDSVAATEELFGPVAPVFRVPTPEAALALANATRFGLGASVWTRDAERAAYFISELAAGMVFVNEVVVSDPRVPFGGVKSSGVGRELGAPGFREFANIKTVRVAE